MSIMGILYRYSSTEGEMQSGKTDLDGPLYQTKITDNGKRASKRRRAQTWITILLFLAIAGIAVWYASVIPPGEGVDEIPHFQYV
jgi:hypothetical protein